MRKRGYVTIVNLGTGYETLGISKAGTIQWQLDVELTATLQNLLFLVRKLISNKLVEAFDWSSCRKKRVFVGFCAGSRPKSEQKHETKKLVEFHNQPTSINYDVTEDQFKRRKICICYCYGKQKPRIVRGVGYCGGSVALALRLI